MGSAERRQRWAKKQNKKARNKHERLNHNIPPRVSTLGRGVAAILSGGYAGRPLLNIKGIILDEISNPRNQGTH